jgi:hypothetical protein
VDIGQAVLGSGPEAPLAIEKESEDRVLNQAGSILGLVAVGLPFSGFWVEAMDASAPGGQPELSRAVLDDPQNIGVGKPGPRPSESVGSRTAGLAVLGATRWDIIREVVVSGGTPVLQGLIAGLWMSVAAAAGLRESVNGLSCGSTPVSRFSIAGPRCCSERPPS